MLVPIVFGIGIFELARGASLPGLGMSSVESGASDPSSGSEGPGAPAETGSKSVAKSISASLRAYFHGINNRNPRAAWKQFTPRLRKQVPVRKFAAGVSTSHDSNVVIHWIKQKGPRTAIVFVTFTSRQDPAYGPNGESKCHWTLHYTMNLVKGRWLINGTKGHNGSKYTPG